jgi:hypothetical protein
MSYFAIFIQINHFKSHLYIVLFLEHMMFHTTCNELCIVDCSIILVINLINDFMNLHDSKFLFLFIISFMNLVKSKDPIMFCINRFENFPKFRNIVLIYLCGYHHYGYFFQLNKIKFTLLKLL